MKKLVVLIPAYNEEKTIGDVIHRIPKSFLGIDKVECLVVDDGSTDATSQVAQGHGAQVLRHQKNTGVGTALTDGLEGALRLNASIVVNIDADGQFEPEEIKDLIAPIISGQADFCAGNRFTNWRPKNMPLSKYFGNKIMSALISSLTGEKFTDVSCGFRAYSREAILRLNMFGKFTYTQEMFLDLKSKKISIAQVPISVKYFKDRTSKVANSLFRYFGRTATIILRSFIYYHPFRFFCLPSAVIMLAGLGFIGSLLAYHWQTGFYSPYKAYGFIGAGLLIFGLLIFIVGLLADILDKLRITQERILYFQKKKEYEHDDA